MFVDRRNSSIVAGAGVLAFGASVYLCARALRERTNISNKGPPRHIHASQTASSVNPKKKLAADVPEENESVNTSSGGCEGCSCGLEQPGPIEGTMHAYERHVIICSGVEDWPKVIEAEENSVASRLNDLCMAHNLIWTKKSAKTAVANPSKAPNRVKISACSEPSRGPPGTMDFIVYPEGLLYTLDVESPSDDSMKRFVQTQLVEGNLAQDLKPVPVRYKKMVLVCTHMSRDKRCGRAGPQVVDEMVKELRERGVGDDRVAVRGSSHFGGHRYAGVLIIYPSGDWYGMVSKRNAPEIVEKCVIDSGVVKANWRGNMANPGKKADPTSTTPVHQEKTTEETDRSSAATQNRGDGA